VNVTLAVIAAVLPFVCSMRAAQSEQEAVSLLTTGQWRFHGVARTFNPDGTFTSTNGSTGTWKITPDEVEMVFQNQARHVFYLPLDPNGTRGMDSNGKPETLTRVSPKAASASRTAANESPTPLPTPPIPSEVQERASEIVKADHESLVFVTGTEGAGSGFIAAIGNANFLITNVHVTAALHDAAFKTLDGVAIQGGAPSLAVGEDIFCMARPPGGKPLELMQDVDANETIGDWIVVLGNAEGGGVVNTIIGKIVGVGPNLVEIDAPIVPGNSGSPIIDLKTGKVVGVATYLTVEQYDLATFRALKQPRIRRFGYRLDTVKAWQPVNWRAFNAEADQMDTIKTLTDDFYNFFFELALNRKNFVPQWHGDALIRSRVDDWMTLKSQHPSPEDGAQADANFISFLKTACFSDINASQDEMTYDYFRRDLGDQRLIRGQMAGGFEGVIQAHSQ
jgi:hypothetical protein